MEAKKLSIAEIKEVKGIEKAIAESVAAIEKIKSEIESQGIKRLTIETGFKVGDVVVTTGEGKKVRVKLSGVRVEGEVINWCGDIAKWDGKTSAKKRVIRGDGWKLFEAGVDLSYDEKAKIKAKDDRKIAAEATAKAIAAQPKANKEVEKVAPKSEDMKKDNGDIAKASTKKEVPVAEKVKDIEKPVVNKPSVRRVSAKK